jgi:hypothetical protein
MQHLTSLLNKCHDRQVLQHIYITAAMGLLPYVGIVVVRVIITVAFTVVIFVRHLSSYHSTYL